MTEHERRHGLSRKKTCEEWVDDIGRLLLVALFICHCVISGMQLWLLVAAIVGQLILRGFIQ